jgi:hypothetical protein
MYPLCTHCVLTPELESPAIPQVVSASGGASGGRGRRAPWHDAKKDGVPSTCGRCWGGREERRKDVEKGGMVTDCCKNRRKELKRKVQKFYVDVWCP